MKIYTVEQINNYIRNMFDTDFVLSRVNVTGEVSNCKYHPSGHIYFTIKDNNNALSVIMFAGNRNGLGFRLENGMKIVVTGKITVFARDGKYQLYASSIERAGMGELYERYLALKKELEEMGMFDDMYKQPIPYYSAKVGVVTASTGAAIQDIINVSKRRNPYVQIVLYPALVQGDGAVLSICRGIEALERYGVDVIIVGRGGGSIEDLWAFNDENVARTIFECHIPVISAVGHETDFTICDFVADLRAPTPSAAAELVVPDAQKLISDLEYLTSYVNSLMRCRLNDYRKILDSLLEREVLKSPKKLVSNRGLAVEALANALKLKFGEVISKNKEKFLLSVGKLDALSPLKLMSSGYCVAFDKENSVINCVEQVAENDKICVAVFDGKFDCIVKNVTSGGAFYGKR